MGSRALRAAHIVLSIGVAATLLAFGGQLLVSGWFSDVDGGIHRIHELAFGVIEGVIISAGLLSGLYRASSRVAPMQQALLGVLALMVAMALVATVDAFTVVFGGLIGLAAVLHPLRGEVFRPTLRFSRPLGAGAAVIGVALVAYSLAQAVAHHSAPPTDLHVSLAHYAGTTAAALGIALTAGLAALRTRGFRTPVWSVGASLLVLGIASIVEPTQSSSFGTLGGLAAAAAGVTFVVLGERAQRNGG
jgi:hypothetical protein